MVGQRTVLVVEDNPELRSSLRDGLQALGFEVLEAGDGKSARNRLITTLPDMVLLDVMLPECSGYEVCEFIRSHKELAAIPVLMMSARSYPEDRAYAMDCGADAFLAKPFGEEELKAQVQSVLGVRNRTRVVNEVRESA